MFSKFYTVPTMWKSFLAGALLVSATGCKFFTNTQTSVADTGTASTEAQHRDGEYRKLIFSLVTPFAPNVPGLSIPGSNYVLKSADGKTSLIRSMSPRTEKHLEEIANLGITDLIILKKDSWGEVEREKQILIQKHGFSPDRFFRTDLPWKDLPNFVEPCEQTIKALQFLQQSFARGGKVLLHCTVGEDRSGFFSALVRQLYENWSKEKAFADEMCARGYSSGNKHKPDDVVTDVNTALTPLYLHMSRLITEKKISKNFYDVRVCQELAATSATLNVKPYTCAPSPHYMPQPPIENPFFE